MSRKKQNPSVITNSYMTVEKLINDNFSKTKTDEFRKSLKRQTWSKFKDKEVVKLRVSEIEHMAAHFTNGDVVKLLKIFYESPQPQEKIEI